MCVVSMIGDHFQDKWRTIPYVPYVDNGTTPTLAPPYITKDEFANLEREVREMKELLKKALEYDRKNGQPDCYIDDKIQFLKKIAEMVGVDLDEVFNPTS